MLSSWFPQNLSTYGGAIDSLFYFIFYPAVFWFLLAEGLILYFIIRYYSRGGRKASYVTGDSLKQASWVLVPGVVVLLLDLGIDFAGTSAYDRVKAEVPQTDVVVQVVGKQFNWIFTYPGPDGRFGTEDDLELENTLHVPVNKPVRLIMKAEDVIHSFFVPVFRLKQDVLPGREIEAWFEATQSGEYEIACAELCGYGHYTMRGLLTVHEEDSYRAWIESQWPTETEAQEQQ